MERPTDEALRKAGWKVVRVWEHQLKQPGRVVWRLAAALGRAFEE